MIPPTHVFASSLKFPADFHFFIKRNFPTCFFFSAFDKINSWICVQGLCLSRNSRQATQFSTIEQFLFCVFCLFASISVWTFAILTMFERAQCSRVLLNPTTNRSPDYRARCQFSPHLTVFGFRCCFFCPFSVWREVLGESVVLTFVPFVCTKMS